MARLLQSQGNNLQVEKLFLKLEKVYERKHTTLIEFGMPMKINIPNINLKTLTSIHRILRENYPNSALPHDIT